MLKNERKWWKVKKQRNCRTLIFPVARLIDRLIITAGAESSTKLLTDLSTVELNEGFVAD